MRGQQEAVIRFREIVQFGPLPVRTKASAEAALAVLKRTDGSLRSRTDPGACGL
jgi:hypothetical protein